MPTVEPIKLKYAPTVRQPKVPFHSLPGSWVQIGPSSVGKSVVLIRSLVDQDKLGGCFQRYELFSPNIHQDPQFQMLIDYVVSQTGQKPEDFCHEEVDQTFIKSVMEDQKKANAYLRKIGSKRLLSCCIVLDDLGDNAQVVRANSSIVNALFTRGRHYIISTFLLLQKFKMASTNIRFNAMTIIVHKLNSQADLDAICEEFDGITHGKDNFLTMYRKATENKFGFLKIVTGSVPRFYSSFEAEFRLPALDDETHG